MTCYQNTRRCRNCVRSCIVLEDKLAQSRDNTSKLSKKKKSRSGLRSRNCKTQWKTVGRRFEAEPQNEADLEFETGRGASRRRWTRQQRIAVSWLLLRFSHLGTVRHDGSRASKAAVSNPRRWTQQGILSCSISDASTVRAGGQREKRAIRRGRSRIRLGRGAEKHSEACFCGTSARCSQTRVSGWL